MIAQSNYFPSVIEMAIKEGCEKAESVWMGQQVDSVKDKSGSCAIVCILTETSIYIANVGDSRAFISKNNGRICESLSNDHKPSEAPERKRIEAAGGRVY